MFTDSNKNTKTQPTWKVVSENKYKELLYTGNFNDKTIKGKTIDPEIIKFIQYNIEFLDLQFMMKTMKYARREGSCRLAPILALACFRTRAPQEFREIFTEVIKTDEDLNDFLDINKRLGLGLGRSVKRAIGKWLDSLPLQKVLEYKETIRNVLLTTNNIPYTSELIEHVTCISRYFKLQHTTSCRDTR